MGDSTREDGGDEGADIIDLSVKKARKEAADKKAAENSPETLSSDDLPAGRADTRHNALRIIRLKPFRSTKPGGKPKPAINLLAATIRNNARRAKLLREAKTARIIGLHPTMQTPIKVITAGIVTEVQPQTLVDRDVAIGMRRQIKLYPVYLLNQTTLDDPEERIFADDAVKQLAAIAARMQESNPACESESEPVIDSELFDEVALVLLRVSGKNFNGYLNDERVESACRMVIWNVPNARMKSLLDFFRKNPVN